MNKKLMVKAAAATGLLDLFGKTNKKVKPVNSKEKRKKKIAKQSRRKNRKK